MKRVIGWSVGAACAAATVAAAGEPAFVDLSNLQNLSAVSTAVSVAAPPIAPTVPAPYPSGLAAVQYVEPAPGPMVEPSGCGPAGCAPSHHGALKDRLKQWVCYHPGPAVLPQWNPDPGHPPLMAYFPCKPYGGLGCGRQDAAPGTLFLSPANSLSAFRGNVRTPPLPLVGVTPPQDLGQAPTGSAAPRTETDREKDLDAEKEPKKDADKDKKPREMLYQPAAPTPAPATPSVPAVPASNPRPAVQGPRVVPASPAGPTAPPLPGSASSRGGRAPGVFDKLVSSIRSVGGESTPNPEPPATIPGWGYPLLPTAPVTSPTVRPVTARGATPGDEAKLVPAGGPVPADKAGAVRQVNHTHAAPTGGGCADGSCGDKHGHGGLFPCKIVPFGNVRCLGHGNLDGYHFAKAVTLPCPPLQPLAVRACYGLRPICSTAPAWGSEDCRTGRNDAPTVGEALPPVAESAVPAGLPPVPEPTQPFTSP